MGVIRLEQIHAQRIVTTTGRKAKRRHAAVRALLRHWQMYALIAPVMLYFVVFHYWPMYGVQIAFKDFIATKGIGGSPWVGFKHFERFFDSYFFWRLVKNTLGISLLELVVGFPVPIVLALMVNEVRSNGFKRFVQTVTYAPHFLSTVVVVGMVLMFLSPTSGLVNMAVKAFGGEPIFFMTEPGWFKPIYVLSGVWQQMGWSSIIYLAALAGIDPQLHEAARVDGASRLQRIWHINLPGIRPTIVILLILNIGTLMGVGFEKVFLMQNSLNMEGSDVISTYVYRSGILGAQYSFSAAVGLFNSVINFVLLLTVNRIARKVNQVSLW
ncbi:sugar ABC transporter permease [Paenibacillus flagellatus]|uniref:Sugar ABC transporter permease n=2 Tax=Paenibacillus flagellatus TaxID=2211139 RepID=A0A2V5K7Q3_9BACL|nr:sugar ABC transporter permease [Paenibacillus flagellatus]